MMTGMIMLTASLFAATAWAADSADHSKLGGAWQVQGEA